MADLVKIHTKFVQCSLQVRNFDTPGFAMSDCCGRLASTGVVVLNKGTVGYGIYWRCPEHKGVRDIRTGELGPVVTEVVDG